MLLSSSLFSFSKPWILSRRIFYWRTSCCWYFSNSSSLFATLSLSSLRSRSSSWTWLIIPLNLVAAFDKLSLSAPSSSLSAVLWNNYQYILCSHFCNSQIQYFSHPMFVSRYLNLLLNHWFPISYLLAKLLKHQSNF